MSLPTLDKTWIFKSNVLLPTANSNQVDCQRMMLTLKHMLTSANGWTDATGAPTTNSHLWTVGASSNSTVANTSDNWPVSFQGTNTSATIDTTGGLNVLRIKALNSYNSFSVLTVTAGASTAKTTIVTDLNAAFTAAGLTTLQASITGTNQLTISDIGGGNAYIEIDTTANGSTLNNTAQLGFTSTGMKTINCLVWANSTVLPFSWVVLQQTEINPNFQVCLCTGNHGANYYQTDSYVSPVAGFTLTGLVTTAAPLASDRAQFHNSAGGSTQWNYSNGSAFDFVLTVAMSTDGQCTRVMGFLGNVMRMFWLWDKPKNPVSGWTNPAIILMNPNSGVIPTAYTELTDQAQVLGRIGSTWAYFYVTTEFYVNAALGENLFYPNQITGEYQLTPCGLATSTPGVYGRHGEIYDLWYTSGNMFSGTSFPAAGNRQFVNIVYLVHPWNRSVLITT